MAPLAIIVDRPPPLIAFVIEETRLTNITKDIVKLGPIARIAGVLSVVNGLGGASTSISSLSADLRIRGVLTKYFLSSMLLVGVLTSKDVIKGSVLSAHKSRTAINSPMYTIESPITKISSKGFNCLEWTRWLLT